MSLATFLLIKAVLCFAWGVPFVAAPSAVASLYGYTLNPEGLLMARYVGATFIGIGLTCFLIRTVTDPEALQGVTLALFVGDSVGFIVALVGQFGAAAVPLGWVNVALWFLVALGLGYFRFVKLAGT